MKRITTGLALVAVACLAAAFGAGFAIYLRPAAATRNSSGTYALPSPGVPFQSNQVISSTQVNNTFNDLSTEMTASLERSGKGGMLAALRGVDGTVAAPSLSFTSETGSGLYRSGSGDVRMAISGADVEKWSSNGVRVANGAVATPSLSFLNDTGSGFYRSGSNDIRMAINGADVFIPNAAGTASTHLLTLLEPSLANASAVLLDLGKSVGNNSSGNMTFTPNATAANSTFCMQVFGQSSTLCVDGNNKAIVGTGGLTIGTGVTADGSGFKHKRGTAGCATAAAAGATCSTTVTWTTAFANSNYDVLCSGRVVTSGVPIIGNIDNGGSASQTVVVTVATTAAAAQFTNIDCWAVHD